MDKLVSALKQPGYSQNGGKLISTKFSNPFRLDNARIPLIRVQHLETDIQVDLSFTSIISTHNTRLIEFYTEFDPRVKPFLVLIRYWGRHHNIVGSDKIKSYALTLMGIVFLNQKKVVPFVSWLQFFPGVQPIVIDGWNVAFMDDAERVQEELISRGEKLDNVVVDLKTVVELAKEFFQMYSTTDFQNQFVCCKTGVILPKTYLTNRTALEDHVEHPIPNLIQLEPTMPMVIQDPFVLNFNGTEI
jgi:hypothetical protein